MAQTVFVVDDDEPLRDSIRWLLEAHGHRVALYDSAERFLADGGATQSGCLLLDVRMPGMSGQELFDALIERGSRLPVVFITGHGDVPMAVAAVKKGAVDFIEKPFSEQELLRLVAHSLQRDAEQREAVAASASAASRLAALTPREREVLDLVVAGKLNKVIADQLAISPKTVEVHRARVMEKMGVRSVAELVQAVMAGRHG
ncbi:MAG: response regulator [Rhodocyclaceae bacterium]|nr:response regulator [Rhodocyclaceae bacterium]